MTEEERMIETTQAKTTINLLRYLPDYRDECRTRIAWERWFDDMTQASSKLERSLEIFDQYWQTGDEALFDLSLDLLKQVYEKLSMVRLIITKEDADKTSHLQTYLYDLGCALGFK
jgi:hypothetical protein